MLQEKGLIVSDLSCKIWPLAHTCCDGKAGIEARSFAFRVSPVSSTKLDIFRHSCELSHHFDSSP